ncbi:MAG: hypothetical protein FJX95_04245 [Bacteroidetes bacterium]|nr:hypothetical protein [Bacteroidota bacterium]
MKLKTLTLVTLFFQGILTWAQTDTTTDLLGLLGDEEPVIYSTATFKSTRVINGQSIENVAGGVMDFRISHRFGTLNSGVHKMFGLDIASMRLGLEYGITDNWMVGIGRSNVNEEVDGFTKIKLLKQVESGPKKMPISVSYFGSIVMRGTEWANPERTNYFTSRLYYCNQLLIAKKVDDKLSLQLSPTHVHRNIVATVDIPHDVFAVGLGGRYKLSRRLAVNAEYFKLTQNNIPGATNSLSLGVDLETGGHVFQLHLTNGSSMNEKGFITETTGSWNKGDIQFGFNISRVFTVKKPKGYQE